MIYFWIGVTVLSILSQVPHAYWAIEDFSIIKNKRMRVVQNVAFCLIISLMIFGFAIGGELVFAFGLTVVDVIINVYYFQRGMSGVSADTKKKKWLRHVLAVVMPLLIFISALMIETEYEKQEELNQTQISE